MFNNRERGEGGGLKTPANEETLLRKHVSLSVSPFGHERNIFWGNIFYIFQKRFVSATNFSPFAC